MEAWYPKRKWKQFRSRRNGILGRKRLRFPNKDKARRYFTVNCLLLIAIDRHRDATGLAGLKTKHRYDEVLTFLLDAEELLGIYGLHVPDLGLPAAHDFSSNVDAKSDA